MHHKPAVVSNKPKPASTVPAAVVRPGRKSGAATNCLCGHWTPAPVIDVYCITGEMPAKKRGRTSHQSESSTEVTPPVPAGILSSVTPAASRAQVDCCCGSISMLLDSPSALFDM